MKVWKIDRADDPGSPLIVDETFLKSNLLHELESADVGSSFIIQVQEMIKEEFNALSEWTGW